MPIDDVRTQVSAAEWQTRVDLAACYRLIALYGWDDLIFTHISARVPGTDDFLINPYGFMFAEMTASALVRVDLDGCPTLPSAHPINPAGYTIHSAVHAVRHDVACVLHIHTTAGIAVSAQQGGLLPISQQSLFPLVSLAYHGYEGVALNHDEKARLQADLGNKRFMILPNHGLLTVGPSIPDAFLAMYILQQACEIQIAAQASGKALIEVPAAIVAGMQAQSEAVLRGAGGALAWPGLLRKLDRENPGYAV
jgi:ribulose-5-phosphate 4-epimerase/fuculose-1-phosphate aldolase